MKLSSQIDQIADDLEKSEPMIALALDRVSDALEKTAVEDSKAGTKFYDTLNGRIKEFQSQIKEVEQLNDRVAGLIDQVVDLAKKVYEEGKDYHGEDFIFQTFPRDSWKKIEESDLYETADILRGLQTTYEKHKRDLQDELKKKEGQ